MCAVPLLRVSVARDSWASPGEEQPHMSQASPVTTILLFFNRSGENKTKLNLLLHKSFRFIVEFKHSFKKLRTKSVYNHLPEKVHILGHDPCISNSSRSKANPVLYRTRWRYPGRAHLRLHIPALANPLVVTDLQQGSRIGKCRYFAS